MHGRPGEKKENWLLIKAQGRGGAQRQDPDILEEKPLSVVSGRSIEEIAAGKGKKRVWHSNKSVKENVQGRSDQRQWRLRRAAQSRSKHARAPPPDISREQAQAKYAQEQGDESAAGRRAVAGLRAALARDPADDGAERPGLGARDQVRRLSHPGAARPRRGAAAHPQGSRLDRQISQRGGGGRQAAGRDRADRRRGRGRGRARRFAASRCCRRRSRMGDRDRFVYYVFDLLHLDGRDLARAAADRAQGRARAAARARQASGAIRYSEHFDERRRARSAARLRHGARRDRLEARRRALSLRPLGDASSRPNARTRQEFVVGGYSPSTRAAAGDRRPGRRLLR